MSQYQCQNWRALIKIPSDFRKQPLLRVAENTERAVDWVGAVQQLKSSDHLAGTGSSASLPLMVVVTIRAVNEDSRNLQWPEKAAWSAKIHGQTPPSILKVWLTMDIAVQQWVGCEDGDPLETTSNCTGQDKWSLNPLSVHDHAALNMWNTKSGLEVCKVSLLTSDAQWCRVSPGQSSHYTGGATIRPGLSIRAPGPQHSHCQTSILSISLNIFIHNTWCWCMVSWH